MLKRSSRLLLQWLIASSVLGAAAPPVWAQDFSFAANGRIAPVPHSPDNRFLERFALASDRESLLQELIPGTEPYFYFNALHYQSVGNLAESNRFLDLWKGALNDSPSLRGMRLRQTLLSYPEDQAGVRQFLQQHYGLQLDASAPQKDEAASLSSSLVPALVDLSARLKATYGHSKLQQLEPSAVNIVGSWSTDENDTLLWLSNVQRIDAPGLLDAIERDLQRPHSQGFGWAPIHPLLTLEQLKQLEKRVPSLLESGNYINTRLQKIRPTEFDSISNSEEHRRILSELEEFTQKLPESQNSLKAGVLYERLTLDEQDGVFDLERFKKYLSLPRSSQFPAPSQRQIAKAQQYADLNANFQSVALIKPIGNDASLIERYIEHFIRLSATKGEEAISELLDSFAEWIDRDFLKRESAKTLILYGLGDSRKHYVQLDPVAQKELQSRVEVAFLPNNRKKYSADEQVAIQLKLKNTPETLIKIYKINSLELLSKTTESLHSGLDVDGLVPNLEKRFRYAQPSERRHEETIELEELQGAGTWIVDVLASGRRARALIQKGALHALHSSSDAGNLVRIVDETGKHVPEARAILGEAEYKPDVDGNITLPFANETKSATLVLVHGALAARESFTHYAENYSLQTKFLYDPQEFLTGALAKIGIRIDLRCNDKSTDLDALDKVHLIAQFTDQDGVATLRSLPISSEELKKSGASHDLAHSVLVPPRTTKVSFELTGRVKCLSNDTFKQLSSKSEFEINQANSVVQSRDAYLRSLPDGYRIEVLGRNGEAISRLPVTVEVKQRGLVYTVSSRLATDENGSVHLGAIEQAEWITIIGHDLQLRRFQIAAPKQDWPKSLQLPKGKRIELPIGEGELHGIQRFTLVECRDGQNIQDISAQLQIHPFSLATGELEVGTYELTDHASGAVCTILVAPGVLAEGVISNGKWIGEVTATTPAVIEKTTLQEDMLGLALKNWNANTQVYVVATPFVPSNNLVDRWRLNHPVLDSRKLDCVNSLYLDSLKLDEEYQYVLDRRNAKKYAGNMLAPPSTLLHPWELATTANTTNRAEAGDEIPQIEARSSGGDEQLERASEPVASGDEFTSDFEFLKTPGLLINRVPLSDQGVASLKRDSLGGASHVTWVVLSDAGIASATTRLPAQELKKVDRRVPKVLEADKHFTETKSARVLAKDQAHRLGDVQSTRVQTFSTLQDVLKLYRSLLQDHPSLVRWEPLLQWESLSDKEKEILYSRLASHEVNLFVYNQDRPFFDRVVAPFLKNKGEKQFLDHYLLGEDLSQYTSAWRMAQLNAAEKALLAQRLQSQSPAIDRAMKDWVDANPLPPDFVAKAFETSLATTQLFFGSEFKKNLSDDPFFDGTEQGVWDDKLSAQQPAAGLPISPGQSFPNGNAQGYGAMAFDAESPKVGYGMMGGMGGGMGGYGMGGGYGAPQRLNESLLAEEAQIQNSKKESKDRQLGALDAPSNRPSNANGRGGRRRQAMAKQDSDPAKRGYLAIESTRKWAETTYFGIPIGAQNSDLIRATEFWLDFLHHTNVDDAFISQNLEKAATSPTSALMALAILKLPLTGEAPGLKVHEGQWVVEPKSTAVVFTKGLEVVSEKDEASPVLLSQQIYPTSAGTDVNKPINGGTLVRGQIYRLRTVVTNPTPEEWKGAVIQQIPSGAIAIGGSKPIHSLELTLQPFASMDVSALFYMPSVEPSKDPAGGELQFQLGGARLTSNGKQAGRSSDVAIQVEAVPTDVDSTQWSHIANWGSNEQVLEYLRKNNLAKTDLNGVAWRLKDKVFYDELIKLLESSGRYDSLVWGYAWLHNDAPRITAYLENRQDIVQQLLPVFESNALKVQAESRFQFEHLDFRPLVLSRFHRLGDRPQILNDSLQMQYDQFLQKLSQQQSLSAQDRLAMTYYLLLQNRIEEALEQFEKTPLVDGELKIQRDYMAAYLAVTQADYAAATKIADAYVDYPVVRWNGLFEQIRSQIKERNGLAKSKGISQPASAEFEDDAERILSDGREAMQGELADKQTVLDLSAEGNSVQLQYRNCTEVEVRYYLMDIELQFSRNPFVARNEQNVNLIEPNMRETKKLSSESGAQSIAWELPDNFKNKNLLVEIVGNGQTRSQMIYANTLRVTLATQAGRLQIQEKQSLEPISEAYIKVYNRDVGGGIQFYKDGYTDLRGIFDYSTVSVGELESVDRFSILILHPTHGAVVKETAPPSR